jgi:hypothetical protein
MTALSAQVVLSNGVTWAIGTVDSVTQLLSYGAPRQVAGVNPGGTLTSLATDNAGNLLVNVAVGGAGSGGGTVALATGAAVAQNGISLAASGVTPLSGTFTTSGSSAAFTPLAGRPFNVACWIAGQTAPGTSLGGTVYLARSTDGGTTYLPLTAGGTQLEMFTQNASEQWTEYQTGVTYELICTSASQTINWRLSQ